MSITVAGRDLKPGDRYRDRMRCKVVTVCNTPWVNDRGTFSDGRPMGSVWVPILQHGDTVLDINETVEVVARGCMSLGDPGVDPADVEKVAERAAEIEAILREKEKM